MIVAYISKTDKEYFSELEDDFIDVKNFNSVDEFISFYAKSKNRDIALLYRVDRLSDIDELTNIHFRDNIYMIVIGKNSVEYSLLAGKLGVDSYINETEANVEIVKNIIIQSQGIIKKRRGKSNISVFAGVSGGMGTTTIAMNLSKNLAQNNLDKNILFLDFAHTKAVSNLFFNYPLPEKNITNIVDIQNLSIEELLENGMQKHTNNLFFVPGIQKHTEFDELKKPENIQKFLSFINFTKEYFDFVLIDVGVFEDVELEVDIQEIADNLFVVTEFSIPSMSILKTYIDIVDKSGWFNKTHIIANRADSFGGINELEAKKILSKGLKNDFKIAYSLPNDAMHLRECWNEAQLANDVHPKSPFIKGLEEMGDRFFIEYVKKQNHTQKEKNTLLQRVKKWL